MDIPEFTMPLLQKTGLKNLAGHYIVMMVVL
jgi:hypothetical protein